MHYHCMARPPTTEVRAALASRLGHLQGPLSLAGLHPCKAPLPSSAGASGSVMSALLRWWRLLFKLLQTVLVQWQLRGCVCV
eukprot:175695-Chlamydomonas_euryale.AAC.1